MTTESKEAGTENPKQGASVAVQIVVSVWELIKPLVVCLMTMIPGHLVIELYGFNGITATPLFWGGMIYMAYVRNLRRSKRQA